MRRVAAGVVSALFGFLGSVQAQGLSLSQLEAAARENASAVQLRKVETRAAAAEKDAAQALVGARVIGGVGVSDTREPVTTETARQYRRAAASVGVRWPLLGSRLAQQRDADAAQWQESRARLRESIAAEGAVRELRLAIVRGATAGERLGVANAYLQAQSELEAQLQARQRRGAMLTAEVLDLTALSGAVDVARMRQQQALRETKRVVQRLTGYEGDARVGLPTWPTTCLDPDRLLSADGRGREAMAELDVAAAQAQLDLVGDGIAQSAEAGVQLTHSQSRDFPGRSGHSTGVSVDVSIPMQWQKVRQARRAQWLERKRLASESAQAERALRQEEIERALAERALLQAELDQQRRRLRAAQEGLRVARLRMPALDGDGYAKLWLSRHAVYTAALQLIDVNERRHVQEIELMALGPACETPPSAEAVSSIDSAALRELASDVGVKPSLSASLPAQQGRLLGWFVWDGASLLKRPERLDGVASGSGRLLLSFSAREIETLDASAWRALRERADARQLRLELLLGDPEWVTPSGRAALLQLLQKAQDWPVQGLNLDIERSQLRSTMTADTWHREVLATLGAVRAAVPWHLSLTTHHRDLDDAEFLDALKASGVDEAVAMVYTTREATARATIERLLAKTARGPRIALAQSVESALPANESSFLKGRSASSTIWRNLVTALSPNQRFSGLIVQSLADYEKARP